MLRIYFIVFIVLSVLLGAGAYLLLAAEDQESVDQIVVEGDDEEGEDEVDSLEEESDEEDEAVDELEEKKDPDFKMLYVPITDPFVLNVFYLGKKFMVQIRFVMVVDSVNTEVLMLNNMALIFSTISSILNSFEPEILVTYSKRDLVASMVLKNLNSAIADLEPLKGNSLDNLIISSYIIQ